MPGALRKDVISEMGFVLPGKKLRSPVVSTLLNLFTHLTHVF